MKLTKENVCVFIENEQQLEEAKKMLEVNNQMMNGCMFLSPETDEADNYLQCFPDSEDWGLCYHLDQPIITIQQLEEILKEAK